MTEDWEEIFEAGSDGLTIVGALLSHYSGGLSEDEVNVVASSIIGSKDRYELELMAQILAHQCSSLIESLSELLGVTPLELFETIGLSKQQLRVKKEEGE